MKKYDLKPIWKANIEIYKQIEAICCAHNLRVYAGFGSALGAIRHQGFIPWDDDIDLLMPRADYEKFWEIAKTEMPDSYKIVTYKLDKNYPHRFGKVYEGRQAVLEKLRKESSFQLADGISVDIFPLDGSPKSPFLNFIWRLKIAFYKTVRLALTRKVFKKLPFFLKIRYLLGCCFLPFYKKYDVYSMYCKIEDAMTEYCFDTSAYAGVIDCVYGQKAWRIPKEVYGKGIECRFQDTTIILPEKYDLYLSCVYGNYMKLPPKEAQVPSHLT